MNRSTYTDATRDLWRQNWLWSLHAFTSLRDQEELWLAKRPGEMHSYDECMCGYFDDVLHGQSLQDVQAQGLITESELEATRGFHELARDYQPPGDDPTILADPKWHAIVAAAQQAWQRLRPVITSEEEHNIMADRDRQQKV